MSIQIHIFVTEDGIRCEATTPFGDGFTQNEANILALGALEIAKSSLLLHRWGVKFGDIHPEAIVKQPKSKRAKTSAAGEKGT